MRKPWFSSAGAALLLASALMADSPERPRQGSSGSPGGQTRVLRTSTVGSTAVSPPASFSLNLQGDITLTGFVFQGSTPFIHNYGGSLHGNMAVGLDALVNVTPSIPFSGAGARNSAFGGKALTSNTSGNWNTAIGFQAMRENTDGGGNTAIGTYALRFLSDGSNNIALGGGSQLVTGDRNIFIGNPGVSNVSGTIRIGSANNQTTTLIEGISDAEVVGSPVCITSGDELGLCPTEPGDQVSVGSFSPALLAELRRLEAELATLRRRLEQLEGER